MHLKIIQFWGSLPLTFLQKMGRFLGYLIYKISYKKYGARIDDHASTAGYVSREFHNEAAREIGAMFGEIPYIWFNFEKAFKRLTLKSPDVLEKLKQNPNQSYLFICLHMGCFEVVSRFLSLHFPIVVMYRPAKKKFFEPVLSKVRETENTKAVPANFSGVREFIKALRSGKSVGLLPDQVPATSDGVWVKFFGRDAYTITLPGKLVSQTKAIPILIYAIRKDVGQGWDLYMKEGPKLDGLPAEQQAQLINNELEEAIRKAPTQYLWSYNRFREPPFAPNPSNASSKSDS
ncbi:lipid A biosynthesis acyltransferase [Taylorella asinigenitalis]|uniref:Lipid A biosynthesis lauroyl acyltransferase n=1 Tax=Taylorella asinigenitalis (strain MCE3) TaxID=1008459 RepID=G4QD43_TAYAM|nr:lipid A biosynthesis acyltransferase [Taylorella asinigenitalis]AEP35860.1 Lipid A biosynthesis lauroyl acyltransferase [Taylorella asinigenitalis MCE3]